MEHSGIDQKKRGELLKNFIAKAFLNNPIRFRLFLLILGIVSAFGHPWFEMRATMAFSILKAFLLLGFSTAAYTFILTLYRLFQRLFRREPSLGEMARDFDERNLVSAIGLYWFLPFGLTLRVLSKFNYIAEANFGTVLIIQGLALVLGTWFSRILKK